MADLRELVESLGHTQVRSYIQSGNLIFEAARRPSPAGLQAAIAERLGVDVEVVLRSPAELHAAMRADPFPDADRSTVHIGFMAAQPAPGLAESVDRARFLPDEFAIVRTELYLHLPNGQARTKLPPHLARHLRVATTIRNWNTVSKLTELSGA